MGCCSSKTSLSTRHPDVAGNTVNLPIVEAIASPTSPHSPVVNDVYESPNFNELYEPQFLTFICEVQLPVERNACNITDSVELPDGQLILCDQRNGKLFLFDEDFKFKSDIDLGGLPYKLTDMPWRRNCLAVSILSGDKIQYVNVNNGMLHVQEIELRTPSKCRSIDSSSRALIYVMDDVIAIQYQGNTVLKMEHDFHRPVSMAVDRKTESVFILCEDETNSARLLKVKLDGNVREIDNSYKGIKTPVSMCADNRGCIYICGRDPPSIYKLSPAGENLGAVYTAKFGLLQHLQYCRSNDVFLLTKPNTNKIWIYRFE